jgi:hypothetical protein
MNAAAKDWTRQEGWKGAVTWVYQDHYAIVIHLNICSRNRPFKITNGTSFDSSWPSLPKAKARVLALLANLS